MRRIFLVAIFFPVLVWADLGGEVNTLLDRFFGDNEATAVSIESEKSAEKSAENLTSEAVPEIILPKTLTESDFEAFSEKIREQERELQQLDTEILDAQAELYEYQVQSQQEKTKLQQLDIDLQTAQNRHQVLSNQATDWEAELIAVTRKISDLRARIRMEKSALEKLLAQNYLRQQNLEQGNQIITWLFSDTPISELLQQKQIVRQRESQRYHRLRNLEKLQTALALEEKKSAEYFGRLSRLRDDVDGQKRALTDLTQAKADQLSQLELTQSQTETKLRNSLQKRAESFSFLKSLHEKFAEISEKLGSGLENPEAVEIPEIASPDDESEDSVAPITAETWQFPLKIPRKITARFLEPAYESRFGFPHQGVDFLAPQGTPIYAPKSATVKKVVDNGYDYSYLILDHGDDVYTLYGHVSGIFVEEGDELTQGQKIALTGGAPGTPGAGAFTTGAHLHLELFRGGDHADPLELFPELIFQ